MFSRVVILALCFFAAAAYLSRATTTEIVPVHESLADMPLDLGRWHGQDEPGLDDKVMAILGVDDYLNRTYVGPDGEVGLYIGYYESQRQGDTMHSPLNCLPGAGWDPVRREFIRIPVDSGTQAADSQQQIEINRITIQKGIDRQVVLYWYQSHGRAVASEYWGKIYTVLDAMRMNRTDAALVRVISSVVGLDDQAEAVSERHAVEFVRTVFPMLSRFLPM